MKFDRFVRDPCLPSVNRRWDVSGDRNPWRKSVFGKSGSCRRFYGHVRRIRFEINGRNKIMARNWISIRRDVYASGNSWIRAQSTRQYYKNKQMSVSAPLSHRYFIVIYKLRARTADTAVARADICLFCRSRTPFRARRVRGIAIIIV